MAIKHVTAEMINRIIEEALKQQAVIAPHPELVSLQPRVEAARAVVADLLGSRPKTDSLTKLRSEARDADQLHDDYHRLLRGLLDAFRHHPDEALSEAVGLLLEVLYPEGLTLITAAWEAEVAHGATYQKRLERADVVSAIETLEPHLPFVNDYFSRLASATDALGAVLSQIAEAEVTRAAQKTDPKLFKARTQALTAWSAFAGIVGLVYAGDSPTDCAAREALLGRWNRILGLEGTTTDASDGSEGA